MRFDWTGTDVLEETELEGLLNELKQLKAKGGPPIGEIEIAVKKDLDPEDFAMIWNAMDIDGNGSIDKDEFR